MFYGPELLYGILIAITKISILFSYRRIFNRVEWLRVPILLLGGLVVGWGILHAFTVIFQCTPIDKTWLPEKPSHYIDTDSIFWDNAISNTILDWLILMTPIAPVLRLHMKKIQKLLVLGSFKSSAMYHQLPTTPQF